MPKSPAKRPIIQHTIDEGVQVQPKHGKEMQDLLRKARATMMRLDSENQSLKRLQESTKAFAASKSDCDAETSTDDIPKKRRILKMSPEQKKKYGLLNAVDTLDSLIETGGTKIKKVYPDIDGLPKVRVIENVKFVDYDDKPTDDQVLNDFGMIVDKKRLLLQKQVADFQKELNSDVKKMLRKSKKDNPQVATLKESFDRIGRLIANLKTDLDMKNKHPTGFNFEVKRRVLEKIPEDKVDDKRREIIGKLRELSKPGDTTQAVKK